MQLINKTTGYSAKLIQYTLSNCKVAVYENGVSTPETYYTFNISADFQSIADNNLSIEDNIIKAILNYLLTKDEFQGYELELVSTNNWLFPSRSIRIIMPTLFTLNSLANDDAVGQLFDSLRLTLKEFIIKGKQHYIVYLEELYQEHRDILEASNEIIIQEQI